MYLRQGTSFTSSQWHHSVDIVRSHSCAHPLRAGSQLDTCALQLVCLFVTVVNLC